MTLSTDCESIKNGSTSLAKLLKFKLSHCFKNSLINVSLSLFKKSLIKLKFGSVKPYK